MFGVDRKAPWHGTAGDLFLDRYHAALVSQVSGSRLAGPSEKSSRTAC